jgi:hypothetical protein
MKGKITINAKSISLSKWRTGCANRGCNTINNIEGA